MKELIKITENNGKKVVSAKELYLLLGYDKSNWASWSKKNVLENEFSIENEDWIGFVVTTNGNDTKDFALTMDFAKRLSMMAKTDKGESVRKYFIECEKQLITPKVPTLLEQTRLLLQSLEENEALKAQSLLDKPKVDFYNEVADTTSSFDFQDVSAMLKLKYGRNTLFKKLREASILMSDNLPYREHIDSERFIVVETKWVNPKNQAVTAIKQTRITQKGLDWLLKNKDKYEL